MKQIKLLISTKNKNKMFPLGIEPRTFLSEASNLTTGLSTLLTKHKIINKKQTYFCNIAPPTNKRQKKIAFKLQMVVDE